jgi:hypothetical protein
LEKTRAEQQQKQLREDMEELEKNVHKGKKNLDL